MNRTKQFSAGAGEGIIFLNVNISSVTLCNICFIAQMHGAQYKSTIIFYLLKSIMLTMYLQPHYRNGAGVFGTVYVSAGQH